MVFLWAELATFDSFAISVRSAGTLGRIFVSCVAAPGDPGWIVTGLGLAALAALAALATLAL